jgi:hypothetical protein
MHAQAESADVLKHSSFSQSVSMCDYYINYILNLIALLISYFSGFIFCEYVGWYSQLV